MTKYYVKKNKYPIEDIIRALKMNDLVRAKKYAQYQTMTLPERQAYRIGRVLMVLTDPTNDLYSPRLAKKFLSLFSPLYGEL